MHIPRFVVSLPVTKKYTMKELLTKDDLVSLLRTKKAEVIEALNGKHVVYLNEGPSEVKPNGIRRFKILDIENVGVGKSGRNYLTAKVQDEDDMGNVCYRNLHIAGLELAWE